MFGPELFLSNVAEPGDADTLALLSTVVIVIIAPHRVLREKEGDVSANHTEE